MAVGSFNVYIIQPAWLIEMGILVEDLEELSVEVNFAEPGFRIRCPADEMTWSVQPTRIVVETTRAKTDCGHSMALVLKNLPHTPLQAIGSNARYDSTLRGDEADRFFAGLPRASATLEPDRTVTQQTRHLGITEGDRIYNLSVIQKPDALQLSVNVHTALSGKKSPFPQQVATDFMKHLRTAEELASRVFQARIVHEPPDNEP